jgi:protoporphyrin/coproporphyrin ferrochelatase
VALLLVNFGGPRDCSEIQEFLEELLTDRDVVHSRLPTPLHNLLFRRLARRRALKVIEDYKHIGGGSPIYADTEQIAEFLRVRLGEAVVTFHRYLPRTHARSVKEICQLRTESIDVLPLFPQFTFATTGSVARWMRRHLPRNVVRRLAWIRSYPDHTGFVGAYQHCIRDFLAQKNLCEEDVLFLFSAHGIPQAFLRYGDPYQEECERSVRAVMQAFPTAESLLAYQSQFGPEEWLRPYTSEVAAEILRFSQGRRFVVIIPISFTSDHIETLFEIEQQYLPPIKKAGLAAYRCPALNLRSDWLERLMAILNSVPRVKTTDLIRRRLFLRWVGEAQAVGRDGIRQQHQDNVASTYSRGGLHPVANAAGLGTEIRSDKDNFLARR